uniref:KEOPS complex subunit Cgi121 n=1 Tax=Cryptosporangium minutisporangium TaxID=113569 RepID=UPI00366B0BC5
VEILLYAAGRRQIDRALEMGVSEGENPVVVVVDGEGDETGALEALRELPAYVAEEPTLGVYDEETICSYFAITDAERGATDASLEDLVRERVALLEVEK